MKIVGIATVLDEAPIIDSTARHLFAQGVDHLIISDGGSTDGTRRILANLPNTTVVDQAGPLYQDTEMTRLARMARGMDADWVVPFDADEYWSGVHGTIRAMIEYLEGQMDLLDPFPDGVYKLAAPVWHHLTADTRTLQPKLHKVAFRPVGDFTIEWGNHNVHGLPVAQAIGGLLEVRELQYRSYDHFLAKIERAKRLYDSADFPLEYGVHLRRLVAMTDDERKAEWVSMVNQPFVYDPIPC